MLHIKVQDYTIKDPQVELTPVDNGRTKRALRLLSMRSVMHLPGIVGWYKSRIHEMPDDSQKKDSTICTSTGEP